MLKKKIHYDINKGENYAKKIQPNLEEKNVKK